MEGDVIVAGVPLLSATALASPKGLTVSAYFKTLVTQVTMTGSIEPGPNLQLTGSAAVSIPMTTANQTRRGHDRGRAGTSRRDGRFPRASEAKPVGGSSVLKRFLDAGAEAFSFTFGQSAVRC
jgi:hypothetical protein